MWKTTFFVMVMHHTISDGWSLSIFFKELEALYRAFAGGLPAPALCLIYQFKARMRLIGNASQCAVKCWRRSSPAGGILWRGAAIRLLAD
jgi:hypothetical protein